MLGHVGADTAATCARLSDITLRKEFERYQHDRVKMDGQLVTFSEDSATAEAEWVKHRISKALQTLPNGECGRPIQQACSHPNARLTCDEQLTDGRYLDAHRDQLARTRKLIAAADSNGNFRMVESYSGWHPPPGWAGPCPAPRSPPPLAAVAANVASRNGPSRSRPPFAPPRPPRPARSPRPWAPPVAAPWR
jgi:hypothetical protein